MLYISTRADHDVYTAHKTIVSDWAPNGGCYVPFRLPIFTDGEIADLKDKQFNRVVADILNLFYSARLTEWDVSFAIGKNPCVMHPMNHRIAVAELWHNPGRDYDYLAEKLYEKLCSNDACSKQSTDWANVAIDLAIIFGIYAESLREGVIDIGQRFDISLGTEHFSAICAAWYARKMGLPVGTIICTEKDNGAVWDLIQRGSFSTTQAESNVIPAVERILFGTLGTSAVQELVNCVESHRTFTVGDEEFSSFSEGFFCSVAGSDRAATVINSVYRSNSYAIDHEAALCYGGLQDYRAKNGEGRLTMLLSRHAPDNNI